jgi:hypothetical protein
MVRMLLPLMYYELTNALCTNSALPDKASTYRHVTRIVDIFLNGWKSSSDTP